MAAASTDYFTKVGNPGTATTLDAPGHAIAGTSITVVATTNWPTDTGVIFAIDTVTLVDGEEVRDVGSYTEWEGVVASGTSITNMVLRYGSDQNYPAGSTTRVYVPVASSERNRSVDGILADHSQAGAHEIATNYDPSNPTLETQKWVGVASAVNEATITNAATGSGPSVAATGGDTNIPITLKGKGTGAVKLGQATSTGVQLEADQPILDSAGNEQIKFVKTSSAVNEVTHTNAATGNAPQVGATGGDSNIDLRLVPKGTGNVKTGATGGSIDWWEELGRTTLSGAGDTISVTPITAKKYLVILFAVTSSGQLATRIRFNNDSGSNYAFQQEVNGGAASSLVSQDRIDINSAANELIVFGEMQVINISASEKTFNLSYSLNATAGAGTNITSVTSRGKWANTAAQITRVDVLNAGTGDFAIGSEVVILGHD